MAKIVFELTIGSLTNDEVDDEPTIIKNVESLLKSKYPDSEITEGIDTEYDEED
jgi:hypothetical protein